MLSSSKKAMDINAFKRVVIPRSRDIFSKYGMRKSESASFNSTPDNPAPPVTTARTVIGQIASAQNILASKKSADTK